MPAFAAVPAFVAVPAFACAPLPATACVGRGAARVRRNRPRRGAARRLRMQASEGGRDAEFVLNSDAEQRGGGEAAGNGMEAGRDGSFDWGYWRHSRIAADVSLLPFDVTEVFLPGESKRLHLFEARFLALFEKSVVDYDKHFAHVIYAQDRGALAAYGTLARIRHWRRLDVGVLIEIEATARLRVSSLRRAAPFWVGACAYVDDRPTDPDLLARLRIKERVAWRAVQQIIRICVRLGQSPVRDKADGAAKSVSDTKGKDFVPPFKDLAGDNGLFVLNEPAKILAWETRLKLAAQRAAAGERFDWTSEYLPDDVAVRRAKALSFAAFDFFPSSPALRQRALEGTDTLARLEVVIKGLEDHKKTLAAKQAVLDAFDTN